MYKVARTHLLGCLLIIAAMSSTCTLLAQEHTPDSLIQVEKPKPPGFFNKHQFGLFAEIAFQQTQNPREWQPANRLNLGLNFEGLYGGFFIYNFEGSIEERIIFPNNFRLEYGYFGGFLGLRLFQKAKLEAQIRVNYAKGEMLWKRTDTEYTFFRDEFDILEPEIMVTYSPIRFFSIIANAGYRQLIGLSITGTDENEFSGWFAGFGVRVGLFKR